VDDFLQLEAFIKASWALENLRERPRAFVYPKMGADELESKHDAPEQTPIDDSLPGAAEGDFDCTATKKKPLSVDVRLLDMLKWCFKRP